MVGRKTAYGNFNSAMILVEKLDEIGDTALTKQVTRFVQSVDRGFSVINSIDEDKWLKRLILLWKNDCIKKVAFHPDIDSYIRNVITTKHKIWVRSI